MADATSGKNKVERSPMTSQQLASSPDKSNLIQSGREQHGALPEDIPPPAKLTLEGGGQPGGSVSHLSRAVHMSDADHKLFYKRETVSDLAGSERRSIGTSTQEDGVMKVSSLSSLSEEEAIAPANQIANGEVTLQVERQRSGDSLTVSSELSSPSEGELSVVKPGVAAGVTHSGAPSKPPAGKTTGKSKKAKKKSKKDRKGEEKVRSGKRRGGESKHRKSEGRRRRSDSLTGTSSEEESTPELNRRMAGEGRGGEGRGGEGRGGEGRGGDNQVTSLMIGSYNYVRCHQDVIDTIASPIITFLIVIARACTVMVTPTLSLTIGVAGELSVLVPAVLVEEGVVGGRTVGVVDAVDTERLKQQLQLRIESRKPPSNFETPAAAPIFHPVG